RLGMLICYESIFPEIAHETVLRGANLLVNITNDAWYGRSSAPYQSLAMAVFRAVENKRSLIRAANTGISGFIDPMGHVLKKSDVFIEDALVAQVPMLEVTTVYNRQGFRFGSICAMGMALMLLVRTRRDD
ncbi:MAG: apolipoprotein N-acyltransferase, partial [Desulfobulbus sp.]